MPTSKRLRVSEDDPLTRAIAPPSYESPQERDERLAAEQEAKRVSDAIDEELNRQRISEKKGPKAIKILLLGQSESGKSTTLKNFQLMNSPKAFRSERASWRAVIQLNVVQSIHAILDLMSKAHSSAHNPPISSQPNTPPKEVSPTQPRSSQTQNAPSPVATSRGGANEETSPQCPHPSSHLILRNPFLFSKKSACDSADLIDWSDPDDPGVVLNACAEDMKRLWTDPVIQALMKVEKDETGRNGWVVRFRAMISFLDALDRVTSPRYIPTDDDVLRARLKTLGVSEHRFTMKTGPMGSPMSHDWRVFDVGGQRSLRAAWVPYFDDMNAIIFLAPISCFDQVLQEDPSVNRLADSFLLWKAIVSNPLLKKTELILFLNKCDILRAKLASGIRLADYIVSYGSRPNDFESANLKKKFAGLLKEHSPERLYYFHLTSVTDTKSTTYILENVQDVLVRDNLRRSALVT
ncbi:guanine nucleotide binding protein, alpha subunit [Suillus occidentalis]|nr:guanine nucleotide binding protein, alpha subunit [Suillus occidentalis]